MLAERRRQERLGRLKAEQEAAVGRRLVARRYRQPYLWGSASEPDVPLAQMMRGALLNLPALLATDPWLPIPGNSCSFGFGPEGRPFPVGAAALLWAPEHSRGVCGRCRGRVVVTGGGGLFSVGGLSGVCVDCQRPCSCPVGGLFAVKRVFDAAVEGTPFRITNARFGGCIAARRRPLWEALRALGVRPLPSEAWVAGQEPPAVSFVFG